MASISYSYNALAFERHIQQPLSEEEYNLVRNDVEEFLDEQLEAAVAKHRVLPNPHRFNWKWFAVKAIVAGALIATGIIVNHYDDTPPAKGGKAGEWFHMASAVFILAIIIQPIQYFMSTTKGRLSRGDYEVALKNYFYFHQYKAKASSDYNDYLRRVAKVDADEVEDVLRKQRLSRP